MVINRCKCSGVVKHIDEHFPGIRVFPEISGVFQSGCSPFEQKKGENMFLFIHAKPS
jgi:hypothetical protein